MPETRLRFLKRPSLAALGSNLSRRFGRAVAIRRTAEGLEFTVDGELTELQKQRLELLMERLGFVLEED